MRPPLPNTSQEIYADINRICSTNIINRDQVISIVDVDECIANSFVEKGNWSSDNKLLKEDADEIARLGIFFHPTLVINDFSYRGELYGRDIFYAICSGFRKKPEECH